MRGCGGEPSSTGTGHTVPSVVQATGRGADILSCGDVECNPGPRSTPAVAGGEVPTEWVFPMDVEVVVDADEELPDDVWVHDPIRRNAALDDEAMDLCGELVAAGMVIDDVSELAIAFHHAPLPGEVASAVLVHEDGSEVRGDEAAATQPESPGQTMGRGGIGQVVPARKKTAKEDNGPNRGHVHVPLHRMSF